MTKVSDIISRAYRKIGVEGSGQSITNEESRNALDALNDMMHAWKLAAVDIEHSDLAATDDFPLLPEFREGTVYMLASRLSHDFSFPVGFDPDEWFREFQAAYMTIDTVEMQETLQRLPSSWRHRRL